MMILPTASVLKPTPRQPPRGQALLLTLLILLLTAAAAFGVLSIGRHARVKEMTHFSAKEGAQSGASWIARSLNTVAMNNQAMARLIVDASLINATPTAIDLSIKDLQVLGKFLKKLDLQKLPRDWQPVEKNNLIAKSFNNLIRSTQQDLKQEYAARQLIKKNVKPADLRNMTYVHPNASSNDSGSLWQAIATLDQVNQVILENLEIQTQLNVLRGSILDTTARQTEASALLLPTSQPLVQWQRGTFDDFQSVIFEDQIYQSDMDFYDQVDQTYFYPLKRLLAKPGKPRGWRGKCPISIIRASMRKPPPKRNPNQNTSQSPATFEMLAVENQALLRRLEPIFTQMRHKRLTVHLAKINRQQLAQLWPDPSRPPQPIYNSKWITQLDAIFKIMKNQPQRIREIAFVSLEIKSAYQPANPKFKSPRSWLILNQQPRQTLNVEYYPWDKKLNPKSWEKRGLKQLHPRIWREVWQYKVIQDRSIGLKPLPKAPNTKKRPRHPVYRIDDYLLVGINVGEPLKIASPYNFAKNTARPAPMLYVNPSPPQPPSDQIQRTVVAMNHVRTLPWSNPIAPTQVAPPIIAPYDLLVNNMNNQTFWYQGWSGTAIPNPQPDLSHTIGTTELEPLISHKLYESILSELQTKIQNAPPRDQVP